MTFPYPTMEAMQEAMKSGETTSLELTKYYLDRIATYNESINAVLEVNPDALHLAESLDVERATLGPRGPLHGIPILLKDNINTGDKMHTTAGSIALENHYADEDAFIVKQLREAGAVLLGKANLTEWANFMTEGMTNGYSSHGGQVKNPYGPFDVGGSSSGPGASIAAGFAAASIGTETSGSILSPASRNSLVGIKPTVGLVSRTGIIPIAHSQDTAGPMAPTVADAALILGELTGIDDKDPATAISRGRLEKNYTVYLKSDALKGARLGVPRKFLSEVPEEEVGLFEQALEELKEAGAIIVDDVELPFEERNIQVLLHEFKTDLNAYLGKLPSTMPIHSLKELIEFNEAHKEVALKYGQTLLLESETKSGRLSDAEYLQNRLDDLRASQTDGIDKVINEHQLDALLFVNFWGCDIAARAGYPSITVPAGYTLEGLPFGLTFTGLAFSEGRLIELGYSYEQATQHRRLPDLED
ncbi:amidase family protein [Bacillaceae bacterium S4-13-58]